MVTVHRRKWRTILKRIKRKRKRCFLTPQHQRTCNVACWSHKPIQASTSWRSWRGKRTTSVSECPITMLSAWIWRSRSEARQKWTESGQCHAMVTPASCTTAWWLSLEVIATTCPSMICSLWTCKRSSNAKPSSSSEITTVAQTLILQAWKQSRLPPILRSSSCDQKLINSSNQMRKMKSNSSDSRVSRGDLGVNFKSF